MIPNDLIKSIKDNNCIFFLGAGMSVTSGIPMMKDLSSELYNKYKSDYDTLKEDDNLTTIAGKAIGSIESIKDDLSKILTSHSNDVPTEYRLLTLLAKKFKLEIYTLNYDLQLERSFDRAGLERYNKYYYNDMAFGLDKTSVIKLVGDILNTKSMLVTKEELKTINKSNACEHFNARLKNGCKVVFIGYSMRDDILYNLFSELTVSNVYYVGKVCDRPKEIMDKNQLANSAQSFFCELIRRMDVNFKIAHIKFDGNSFGGIETYLANIVNIASQLDNNRFENDFYNIYTTAQSIVGNKKRLGFPLIKGSSAMTLFKAAALNQYDLFHCHDFISAYHAQMAGLPVVFTSHSLASKDTQNRFDLYNSKSEIARLEEMYYPMIHNIITLSSSHKDELPSFSNLHAKKMFAPFDFDSLDGIASKIQKTNARKHIEKLTDDDFVLLYIGRCDSRKGFHYVIDAFEKLKDTCPSVPFKLMLIMPGVKITDGIISIANGSTASGSAVPEQGIIKFRTKYGKDIITHHIDWGYHFMCENFSDERTICDYFQRHYEEIFRDYKAADMVVIPSLYEPFGYVALEALTCKCPIIANHVDGLAENLKNGVQEFATFCHIGNNPNNIYASDDLYRCISSVIQVKDNKCKVSDDAVCKANLGYDFIKKEYSGENSRAGIKELHELYMQTIINSTEIPFIYDKNRQSEQIGEYEDLYNIIFDYYLNDTSDMPEIIKRAGYIYKDILYLQAKMKRSANPSVNIEEPSGPIEIYSLFWGIAGRILTMKARVKGIAMMNVRTLAETITETTRAQTQTLRSVFALKPWNEFLVMGMEQLKGFYKDKKNREILLENSQYYDHSHGPEEAFYQIDGIKKDIIWHIINNMVRVEETEFMFGGKSSDNCALNIEKPQRKIHLSPYFINKFQVTRREWNIIMSDKVETQYEDKEDYCPVYNVSYNDCVRFIQRLNDYCRFRNFHFDFPTEAQWECAAKCATDCYLYSGSDNLLEVGWFIGNTDKPRPVGLLKENRWGLFDMSGNVQEFCKDVFSPSLPQGERNPCNINRNETDHVTRGGSAAKHAACCRITNRYDRYNENFNCLDNSCFLGLRLTLQYR